MLVLGCNFESIYVVYAVLMCPACCTVDMDLGGGDFVCMNVPRQICNNEKINFDRKPCNALTTLNTRTSISG